MKAEQSLKYWCYNCEKHFQCRDATVLCSYCQSQAVELASDTQSDPSSYSVYRIQQPQTQPASNSNQTSASPSLQQVQVGPFQLGFGQISIRGNHTNVFQMSFNVGNMMQGINPIFNPHGLSQLLNSLLGQNNLIPANAQQIQKLENVQEVSQCSICQQESQEKQKGYKLKCGHAFHVDCLTPWFQRTNTCPTCRQAI